MSPLRKVLGRKTTKSSKTTKATKTRKPVSSGGKVSGKRSDVEIYELISRRAYEIFEDRGYTHGADLSDWVEAEKQIKKLQK